MKRLQCIATATLLSLTLTTSASEIDSLRLKFPDWSLETHSKECDPNYEEIFSISDELQQSVKRIDISIESDNWDAMWDDLDKQFSQMHQGPGQNNRGGDPLSTMNISPIWVPCNIKYNGVEWYSVGVRFKGNSSLMQCYQGGIKKLSMKLDFSRFDDLDPEIKDQRFYGFEQLNLNNNCSDSSFIHEKVTSDLFRAFGIASAHTAFCEVYIDYGSNPRYMGLYTIVEEVDDSLIKHHFEEDSGNIYKPEERAGSFAAGSYNEEQFNKKSNKKEADFQDVRTLYEVLNSEERTTNSEEWMAQLESIFDVDIFLKWLAANTTIQNWDSYGNMAHNYYLYNDPSTEKLVWIPWDHNEALQSGKNAYEPSLLKYAGDQWPLLSYILSCDKYRTIFDRYLTEFSSEIFTPKRMNKIYKSYQKLLKKSVYKEQRGRTFLQDKSQFDSSFKTLKQHVKNREAMVERYLE